MVFYSQPNNKPTNEKKRQVPETKPNDLSIFISGLIVHIQIGTDTTMVNGYKQRTKKNQQPETKKKRSRNPEKPDTFIVENRDRNNTNTYRQIENSF